MAFWVSKPIFILIPLLIISILYSNSFIKGGIINLAKITLWMFLIITVADLVMQGKMQQKTIYIFTVISVILFVASLLFTQLFNRNRPTFIERSNYGVGEFAGFFTYHSISIGLSIGLILVLFMAIKQRNIKNLIFLLILDILILINLMRTFVRSGYVCSVVGIITLAFMILRYEKGESAKQQKQLILVSLILVIIAGIIFGLTHFDALQKRFSDTSGSGRKDVWTYAIKSYIRFPIINKLIGGGYIAIRSFYKDSTMGPHNGYLFFLLEGGILGLITYLWIFISILRQIKFNVQNDYSHFILSVSIIAMFLTGEMLNGVFNIPSVTAYLSFLVGGTLGYYLKFDYEDHENKKLYKGRSIYNEAGNL